MSTYYPDAWVIIKVCSEHGTYYKVLAGWYGGYANGDSWKINSGITKVVKTGNVYAFSGYSGSTYFCTEKDEGLTGLTAAIFDTYQKEVVASNMGTLTLSTVDEVLNHLKEKS